MKRRFWWFRIGLPLLSLLLLAIGVERAVVGRNPDILVLVMGLVALLDGQALLDLGFVDELSLNVIVTMGVLAQWGLIGFGIDWLIERHRRLRIDPTRCPRCGYDIRGLPEPRCPECGGVIELLDPRDNDIETPPRSPRRR